MARDDDFDRPRRSRRDDDDFPPPRQQKSNLGLILGILGGSILLCCGGGIAAVYYFMIKTGEAVKEVVQKVEEAGVNMANAQHDVQTSSSLSQIGRAMHDCDAALGSLPANTYGPKGKPLLSWRVHLLPYIQQDALYKQFKLDEAWDSPNNMRLLNQMPAIYGTQEGIRVAGNNRTYFRAFTGQGYGMEPMNNKMAPNASQPRGQRIQVSFLDGTANTILVFEANDAVEWTKPDEIDWPQNGPKPAAVPGSGGPRPMAPYFWALFADGDVKKIKRSAPNVTLYRLFNRQDGMVITDDWLYVQ